MATWMGVFPRLVRRFQFYFGFIKSQNHFHGSDYVFLGLTPTSGRTSQLNFKSRALTTPESSQSILRVVLPHYSGGFLTHLQ